MMNVRQRSVNVSRVELLAALKANLEIHKAQYIEAVNDFKERLVKDLVLAKKKVEKTNAEDLKTFKFNFSFPSSHEQEFIDIIEMLEVSTDDTINLDHESFKAYFKNQWSWSNSFASTLTQYKSGSFLGG